MEQKAIVSVPKVGTACYPLDHHSRVSLLFLTFQAVLIWRVDALSIFFGLSSKYPPSL